jgi:hypothetical protein
VTGHGSFASGSGNTSSAQSSFVGGGIGNTASGDGSFVGGGQNSTASILSFVGGGHANVAFHSSFVGGGYGNRVLAFQSAVVGGTNNSIPSQAPDGFFNHDDFLGGGGTNHTTVHHP